jgi:hypothetical protein
MGPKRRISYAKDKGFTDRTEDGKFHLLQHILSTDFFITGRTRDKMEEIFHYFDPDNTRRITVDTIETLCERKGYNTAAEKRIQSRDVWNWLNDKFDLDDDKIITEYEFMLALCVHPLTISLTIQPQLTATSFILNLRKSFQDVLDSQLKEIIEKQLPEIVPTKTASR